MGRSDDDGLTRAQFEAFAAELDRKIGAENDRVVDVVNEVVDKQNLVAATMADALGHIVESLTATIGLLSALPMAAEQKAMLLTIRNDLRSAFPSDEAPRLHKPS